MKKISSLALSTIMIVSFCSVSLAQSYTPGVTVEANPDSATGYTATIVYEAPEAEKVVLAGSFAFYYDDPEIRSTTPESYYTPEEWAEGMFAVGQESHKEEMTKVEGTDYFVTTYDLPSGHYQYCFYVDEDEVRKDDPTNPGQYSLVENGGKYTRSVFDVPYDEKQGSSQDYAFAAKRTDDKAGTIEYVAYTDIDGVSQSLGVYLPYDYDADREEPYKVLYLSHGGGGDETFWFGGGSAGNIFDNLIANGEMESTLIVCMNNQNYGWDFEKVGPNQQECIVPFIEENYNVCTEAEGKAYAGLSMGGITTSRMLFNYLEDYSAYGVISAVDNDLDYASLGVDKLNSVTIMTGAGIYDMALNGVQTFNGTLDEIGADYDFYAVEGAHEWFTWMQLLHIFGKDYLWK